MATRTRTLTTGISLLAALLCTPAALASSGGKTGYSGNPATNKGQTCAKCHSGGLTPTVTLSGPTTVETGKTYTYQLLIQGGQQVAAGLGVSATDGALLATEADTWVSNAELTHTVPRRVDPSGDVLYSFDWTAPATTGSVTLYAAGNSVDLNSGKSGDECDVDTLQITVDDASCGVTFAPYGSGTAGTGAFVPDLDGTPGPCTGGASVDFSNGLGSAFGLLWVSPIGMDQVPFVGGHLWIDLTFFVSFPIRLGGTPGVGGAGSASLPVGDASALQGYTLWMQGLFLDGAATKGIALSNGLQMDVS